MQRTSNCSYRSKNFLSTYYPKAHPSPASRQNSRVPTVASYLQWSLRSGRQSTTVQPASLSATTLLVHANPYVYFCFLRERHHSLLSSSSRFPHIFRKQQKQERQCHNEHLHLDRVQGSGCHGQGAQAPRHPVSHVFCSPVYTLYSLGSARARMYCRSAAAFHSS